MPSWQVWYKHNALTYPRLLIVSSRNYGQEVIDCTLSLLSWNHSVCVLRCTTFIRTFLLPHSLTPPSMFDYVLFLLIFHTFATFDYPAFFPVCVEVFLKVRNLLETFRAAVNWAQIGFLPRVNADVIEQALDALEKLTASRVVTGIVSNNFWNQGGRMTLVVLSLCVIQTSFETKLAEQFRFRYRMSMFNIS